MGDDEVRIEQSGKRVRVAFGGRFVADTAAPLLVWEHRYYPAYYLPLADVDPDVLVASGDTYESPALGKGTLSAIKVGERVAEDAVVRYQDSPRLRDHVRIEFAAMDAWFEEDEEIFVHPRDPYKRVDVLDSSRTVRIEIDGVTVAESTRPKLLFETGLPKRYYLPKTDVRLDVLEPSPTTSRCPYKGTAEYYSVRVGEQVHSDVVWYYRTPLPESQKVQGLLCFYDEKVDVFVDGVKQERPRTPFA